MAVTVKSSKIISKILPDATIAEKGITSLTNSYDGQSQTVAVTQKALNDAINLITGDTSGVTEALEQLNIDVYQQLMGFRTTTNLTVPETPTTVGNNTFTWANIDSRYLQQGRIHSIAVTFAETDTDGVTPWVSPSPGEKFYMQVYEYINGNWWWLCTSTNAFELAAGAKIKWIFDDVMTNTVVSNDTTVPCPLRIMFLSEAEYIAANSNPDSGTEVRCVTSGLTIEPDNDNITMIYSSGSWPKRLIMAEIYYFSNEAKHEITSMAGFWDVTNAGTRQYIEGTLQMSVGETRTIEFNCYPTFYNPAVSTPTYTSLVNLINHANNNVTAEVVGTNTFTITARANGLSGVYVSGGLANYTCTDYRGLQRYLPINIG